MSKILGHKVQLALTSLKARKVELQQLQANYEVRWRQHAYRQGKDPNKPPRTIYADMIEDAIKKIDEQIKEINERVVSEKPKNNVK